MGEILDLNKMVVNGELFYAPGGSEKVEAYIPTIYESNHASNIIALKNGDLVCAWFAGSKEGANDIKIAFSRLPKGESKWTMPVLLSEDYTRSEQNPVLFQAPDGKLWLMYTGQLTRNCTEEEWKRKVANGEAKGIFCMQATSLVRCRISEDNGHTWGPVTTMFDRPGTFIRQPIRVLDNGDWIMGMFYCPSDGKGNDNYKADYSVVQISGDQGKSWEEHIVEGSVKRVHMCPIEIGNGELLALFRSRSADRIYMSRSFDYGRTWTPPERTVFPNNNSSIQAARLNNGHIALIFNSTHISDDDVNKVVWPGRRYPIAIAISEDNGETWPHLRVLEPSPGYGFEKEVNVKIEYAYPSITQTDDGFIHVTYTYSIPGHKRVCIKYTRITEDWIKGPGTGV